MQDMIVIQETGDYIHGIALVPEGKTRPQVMKMIDAAHSWAREMEDWDYDDIFDDLEEKGVPIIRSDSFGEWVEPS